jgi:beta-lactamase regulating signal transducer with metallopeptidase domain
MDPLLHAVSFLAAAAAGALFSAIWQGAVLAACVALCLRLLPGLSAATRSLVWMTVFLLLVLLHVLPSLAGHASSGTGSAPPPVQLNVAWSFLIAGLWAAMALGRAAQLLLSAHRSHKLAAQATALQAGATLEALLSVGTDGWLCRRAGLCTSPDVARPSVFGFLRPRILLPASLVETLSPLELQQVVMHEMEHLRRGDDWTNLLQKLGLVLFPLNPVLFWVERRLCAERELACDDRVLRTTGARRAYAVCLTRLAEYSMLRRSFSVVIGALERQSELVSRVHRILRQPQETIGGRRAAVLTAALIAGVLGGAATLARAPMLVSFAPSAQPASVATSLPAESAAQMYRQEFGGTPKLVKAVLPEERPHAPSPAKPRRTSAPKPRVQPSPVLVRQQAWVEFTEWEEAEQPPPVVITVERFRGSSFAAIATANGWLIVQI